MAELKRELNSGHVMALILGMVIGSGVFINLPIVAREAGSPLLAVLAWMIGGIIWLPQVFILAEMATAYPEEGFGYLYLKKAGSPALGFLYVWTVFWTSDAPSITIVSASAVSALAIFWDGFNNPLMIRILGSLIIIVLTSIHYFSVKGGGKSQIILTVAKLSPLMLLIFLGLFLFDKTNLFLHPVVSETTKDKSIITLLVAGVAGTIWSYAGFTNILYMSGEIKNPRKTLPKSLIISVLFVLVAYTLIALATSVFVPYDVLSGISGGFANPFIYLPAFKKIAGGFLALAAFVSMIGCTNAMIMVQPRIEYAIARDGFFFKAFAHIHPRYNTPDYSILLQSGVAIILLMIGGIEGLLGYFTLSYLFQNAMVYGTIFFLKKRDDYHPTYHSPLWKVMAVLAVAIQMYLIYGTFIAYPAGGVIAAILLIATGLPVYWYFKKRNNPASAD